MKVYRFMSKWELDYMLQGGVIVGPKSYEARTDSSGVCFFPEYLDAVGEIDGETWYWSIFPDQYHEFFRGVSRRPYYVLVEFEADESLFTQSWGEYANPDSPFWEDTMCVNELCIPRYSRNIITPLRYSVEGECFDCGSKWEVLQNGKNNM